MRRGCFVDSEFSFCSKTCRIKKELALCADFQPAGKRYPAAECVAELADNIKAAVGRLNNMMNSLFVDARPDDLLRKQKSFEELLAELEGKAGNNAADLESKSDSKSGDLDSSPGNNSAYVGGKGDKSDADD